MAYIILFLLALVVFGAYHLYFLYSDYRLRLLRERRDKIVSSARAGVDRMKSTMTCVQYRGYKIPMTLLEKQEIWDKMDRESRNKALRDFKAALKDGRITEFN